MPRASRLRRADGDRSDAFCGPPDRPLRFKASGTRAGGRLVVTDGALDLSAVTEVVFANTEDLKKGGVYVLAESADGFVLGETPPALAGLPAGPWRLEVYGKTLRLAYPDGTAIILR